MSTNPQDREPKMAITDELLDAAVEALIADGWEETQEGPLGVGTLDRDDLRNIARTVLRARAGL